MNHEMKNLIRSSLKEHRDLQEQVTEDLQEIIFRACAMVMQTIRQGRKILLCGNGGSAADAQHIASEMTGRFVTDRRGLPAIALTTDSSALTAVSNDFGFEQVFARQVEALAAEGDLLIGISTSGNSPNVLQAFAKARELNCTTLGLSGNNGGKFGSYCDLNIVIPSRNTARIQEMHILVGHILCQAVDRLFT